MEKQKQNLFAALVAIVAIAFFYLVAWGKISEAYEAYSLMQSEQKEKESLKFLVSNAPSFKQRFESVRLDAKRILQVAPVTFAEGDYIVAFASLASESGSLLKKIDIKDPEKDGIVQIQAEVVGSVASLERFLRALETSIPFLDFIDTSFDGKEDIHQFKVVAITHLLPASEEKTFPFSELKEHLEKALAIKLDILKDPQFQSLKPSQGVPVREPLRENVGRENPFAPF